MADPTVTADVARLEAALAGLVTDVETELLPGDTERLVALGARCDVILELLRRLQPETIGGDGA